MSAIVREPTHRIRLRENYRIEVGELSQPARGIPAQLSDRLVRDLEKAHTAVAKAEADIRKWLERTDQDEELQTLVQPW